MTTSRDQKAQPEELNQDHGQAGADSGGQSGDTQGLSSVTGEAEDSVEELAETGQDFEAEVLQGVEDASDHSERPVQTHEVRRPPAISGPDRESD